MYSIIKGDKSEKLREKISNPNFDINDSLNKGHCYNFLEGTIEYSSPCCFDILLSAGATVSKYVIKASVKKAYEGENIYLEKLWDHPEFFPEHGLSVCVENKTRSIPLFEKLVSHKKMIKNLSNRCVISSIINSGNTYFFKILKEKKCNFDLNIALLCATYSKKYDFISLFLKWGADINYTNANNMDIPALGIAAKNCNQKMIKYLLESGANPNIVYLDYNYGGMNNMITTPLITVTSLKLRSLRRTYNNNGALKSVKLLLKYGANIDYKSESGLTPLVASIVSINYEMVELLLKSGVNVYENVLLDASMLRTTYKAECNSNLSDMTKIFIKLVEEGVDPYYSDKPLTLLYSLIINRNTKIYSGVIEWYIKDLWDHWNNGDEDYGCEYLLKEYEGMNMIEWILDESYFNYSVYKQLVKLYYLPDYTDRINASMIKFCTYTYRHVFPCPDIRYEMYKLYKDSGVCFTEGTIKKIIELHDKWFTYANYRKKEFKGLSFEEKINKQIQIAEKFMKEIKAPLSNTQLK